MKYSAFLCGLLALGSSANAVHLDLVGRRRNSLLNRRATINGSSVLSDTLDIQYTTNITLGGLLFSVLIDTGSSDLWVASSQAIPGATNTGATSGVQYAVGEVQGPIEIGALEFADFTVANQAFLFITPSADNEDGSGLIGLGPSSGSNILQTLDDAAGNTPLDNIFLQDTSTPNYLTILLGRADDENPFPGDLTVGETLPGYDAVLQQPHLPVTTVSVTDTGDQHWQVLLDANGAIGPNGQSIPITSSVSGSTTPNQANVVFDSGFSLPQVPKALADAYYSPFSGSEFVNVTGVGEVWILPCTAEVNISFKFGGNTYPVHPLDATLEPESLGLSSLQNSQGDNACIGSFQPVSFDSQGLFDMILGMAFLRNVYLLVDFGDFVQNTTDTAPPYIQLLSTTNNSAQANADFVAVRLNNNTSSPDNFNNTNNGGGDGSSPSRSNKTYIIIVIGLAALALATGGLFACIRRRANRRAAASRSWGTYAPLSAPAPAPAMEMQRQGWEQQYGQPYNQPYNQPYGEPWAPHY